MLVRACWWSPKALTLITLSTTYSSPTSGYLTVFAKKYKYSSVGWLILFCEIKSDLAPIEMNAEIQLESVC